MENKIIFLLITIMILYLMFTKNGIATIKKIMTSFGSTSNLTPTPPKVVTPDFGGGSSSGHGSSGSYSTGGGGSAGGGGAFTNPTIKS